jgi:hypothetical protein
MMVYSKNSYNDQDDGHILKAARKQQYIMFPAPISFLNHELKAELGTKTKKEEEEDDTKKITQVPDGCGSQVFQDSPCQDSEIRHGVSRGASQVAHDTQRADEESWVWQKL